MGSRLTAAFCLPAVLYYRHNPPNGVFNDPERAPNPPVHESELIRSTEPLGTACGGKTHCAD